jgi:GC-rich sequence DNA-binding factor
VNLRAFDKLTNTLRFLRQPKKAYTPHPIPTPTTLPSLSSASARLASALSAITLSHADHSTRLEQVSADQAALEAQEADLRKEVERVEKKWEWAVEFKGWVEEVGKFLEAKVGSFSSAPRSTLDRCFRS